MNHLPGHSVTHRSRVAAWILAAMFAVLAAGCSQSVSTKRELTQRERDSTLGKSVLPGASAVTRALQESDRASAASKALDAQVAEQSETP